MRPYNFFSDIRDQRIQSNAHTLLLALIVAVTYAIICSSILYHFRTNGVVDYVLSHFITSSDVKEFIIFLAWNPLLCIGNITAVTLATMFFVVIGIQVGSWFIRTRVYLFHSYSVGIWSTLPMVIFILVGMILYRVMETETYVIPVMIFFALINIWVLLRTLKGISIIYDVFPPKLYAVALVVVLIAVGIWYAYVDHVSSTTAYARFLISTIFPSAQ
jgi:hypothetical protein